MGVEVDDEESVDTDDDRDISVGDGVFKSSHRDTVMQRVRLTSLILPSVGARGGSVGVAVSRLRLDVDK